MKKYLFLIFFIILIAFGIWSYIKYFTGLGPVPVRSAFSSRLPSVVEGDRRRFQFFYATNRENAEETFQDQGHKLGDGILTGTFDVLISPNKFIQPFTWFDKETMTWAGRAEMSPDLFTKKLQEAVQNSPNKSLLIIVWGYRDWFRSAALKTAYTAYNLDINTPVLLFDWPGNQGDGFRGYRAAQQVSLQSAPDLGKIIDQATQTGAENIWIIGSSLGSQTIADAFVWLSDNSKILEDKPKISHVVFSAPDVSAHTFEEKFAEKILKHSKHFTAYVSSNDRALLMSQWLNRGRRLGRTSQIATPPEKRSSEYEFEEALELLELQDKGFKNISVIDATPINLTRNLHHFFTDSPPFFDDLYQRLLQPDHIVSRRLHTMREGSLGETYWILWND